MLLHIVFVILVNILFHCSNASDESKNSFEIIDFEFEGGELVEGEFDLKRLSKFENVLTGYIEFKKDVTDVTHFDVKVFKSENGGADYTPTPFYVPLTPLTKVMNSFYKNLLKNSLEKCTTNYPEFVDGKFQPPLKKGRMVFENCLIGTDDIKENFSPGFYKVINTAHGESHFAFTLTVQIEEVE